MNNLKTRADLIFFIIGFLVFPLMVIGSVYTIFNNQSNNDNKEISLENIDSEINELPFNNNNELNGQEEDAQTSSIETVRTGHSPLGLQKSLDNQLLINNKGNWNATQYTKGDIIANNYLVQLGDTLWQIANAKYGNGNEWTNILNLNKDKIGFLPNGEQALIYPGQIINLP